MILHSYYPLKSWFIAVLALLPSLPLVGKLLKNKSLDDEGLAGEEGGGGDGQGGAADSREDETGGGGERRRADGVEGCRGRGRRARVQEAQRGQDAENKALR